MHQRLTPLAPLWAFYPITLLALCLTWSPSVFAQSDITLRVGISQNEPLIFQDADGAVHGLAPDLLRHVADAEEWRLQPIAAPWPQLLEMLDRGEIDLLPVIAYTPERATRFRFGEETIFTNWGRVYASPDSRIVSILDLQGVRIGVIRGDTHSISLRRMMDAFDLSARYIEYPEYVDILQAVSQGDVDAGVVNRLAGRILGAPLRLNETSILFNPVEIRFATPLNTDPHVLERLDFHLRALKANKTSLFYRSIDTWLHGLPSPQEFPKWLLYISVAAIGSILLLTVMSMLLRRQIAAKTAELAAQNLQLEEEIGVRRAAEERFKASLSEKDALLREVHHRVKNNLQVIISLLRLQAGRSADSATRSGLDDCERRIRSMSMVHERLYKSDNLESVDFGGYLTGMAVDLAASLGCDDVALDVRAEHVELPLDQAIPCGLIVQELVANAIKHAFPGNRSGRVEIGFALDPVSGLLRLNVTDNGVGLPDTAQSETDSLGFKLVSALTSQLNGELRTETRSDGSGTRVEVTFPNVRGHARGV